MTRACLYKVVVYYFNPNHGQQTVPCLNCYLRLTPGPEEYRKFDFLDSRDTLVSSSGGQTIYMNKYDWNPKLIMIMRDLYGNLVTTSTAP